MAAISSIEINDTGAAITATGTALSADDTITIDARKTQLLVLRNTTGSTVNVTLDGDGASATHQVAGVGLIDLTAGKVLAVPANAAVAVKLSALREYCKGVVHLTGGTGVSAHLFNI